ncbi:MAG: hypothetical protein ACLTYW_10505 [Collinsella sp.]
MEADDPRLSRHVATTTACASMAISTAAICAAPARRGDVDRS